MTGDSLAPGVTVVAIHGVGYHRAGDIPEALSRAFVSAGVEGGHVQEFNWNRLVDRPPEEFVEIADIAADFASAASAGFDAPAPDGPYFGHTELVWLDILYRSTQALVAVLLSACLLLPPLVAVGPMWSTLKTELDWGYYLWIIPWLQRLVIVLAAAVAVLLILQLVFGVMTSLTRFALWPLLVVVRRIALGLTNQVILATTVIVSLRPTRLIAIGAFLSLGLLPAALQRFQAGIGLAESLGYWVYPMAVAVFVSANLVVTGVLRAVAAGWIVPLKVALDIVRYVGNPLYRARLQGGLATQIRAIPNDPPGRHIVLAAHSLGSIIAVDALANGAFFEPTDQVTLVTGGSPLRRFFFRFFPRLLFPSSVAAIASQARAGVASFEWLNIYRPLDYVGAGLGLSRAGVGQDIPTFQWLRVISSHSDYWSDARVVRLVRQALGQPSTRRVTGVWDGDRSFFALTTERRRITGEDSLATRLWLFGAIVALNVILFAGAKTRQDSAFDEKLARLESARSNAVAQVSHWQDLASEDELTERHHYLFAFTTASGQPVQSEIGTDTTLLFSSARRRMNEETLRTFIRQRCEYTQGEPTFGFLGFGKPCRRGGITVQYLPTDPLFFTVADFPAERSLTWGVRDWVTTAAYILMTSLMSAALAVFAGVPLFRMLSGQPQQRSAL